MDTKKEKVSLMADKINEAVDSCNFNEAEVLEIFAESVALLVAFWAKKNGWSPLEKASYFGYIATSVMEKSLDDEIENFKDFLKSRETLSTN